MDTHAFSKFFPEKMRDVIMRLCHEFRGVGGRAYVVGGAVRDGLLNRVPKDVDLEVFGLEEDRVEAILRRYCVVDAVGKSFGVFKLRGVDLDVSLPRRERKAGRGHHGFIAETAPFISLEDASRRRDFTINALLLDPLSGELHDPHGGRSDLEGRILRHTSTAFAEDPLRVLRGMQFIARFELRPASETVALCRTIEPEGLSAERCFDEWSKCLVKGKAIGAGLDFLKETGWVQYYPELEKLIGCPQDPQWHPEGDVWAHTLHALDAFAQRRTGDVEEDRLVGFAVLCHDLGKPATTIHEEGRWRSPGHDRAGAVPTRALLGRLTNRTKWIEEVVKLVEGHMRPMALAQTKAGPAAIRRLARDVGRIDRLVRVVEADARGRPPLPPESDTVAHWLRERAEALQVERSAPQPLLQGRDLLALGMAPGPAMGKILKRVYEDQLDGLVTSREEALDRIRSTVPEIPRMGSAQNEGSAGLPPR
jgi:tRNA nucleotidyltransferase (CCA-adding enzyme)